MTDHPTDAIVVGLDALPNDPVPTGWQPLPARAMALSVLGGALPLAMPAAVAGAVLARLFDLLTPWLGAALLALAAALFGAWLGAKQHRSTAWRLDGEGLAVRRGRFWQRETRVPITRVQHLDLKRGPLQRRRHLATLVVHTAGTRHSAVTVPNLDADDAEHLRDRLGQQIDRDDD
jgi:hypothetical protein